MTRSAPTARPLPFSSPMVRAERAGLKTQTRRVITRSWSRCLDLDDPDDVAKALAQCPYGREPGDLLWVREPLRPRHVEVSDCETTAREMVTYDADGAAWSNREGMKPWPWRARYIASRYCPRWASRTMLEVTEVRVERLQSITEEDAIAEGVTLSSVCSYVGRCNSAACPAHNARPAFRELWDSINGARPGCSWDANPHVWALTFRRAP